MVKPEYEVESMLERARRKRALYENDGAIVQLMATRWVEDLEELPRLLANARAAAFEEAALIAERWNNRAIPSPIAAAIRRLK